MAQYRELWESPTDSNLTGYQDTEADGSRCLPVLSQEVADWIADGNTPDPAFTPEEIAAHEAAAKAAEARQYLIETESIISTYNDDIARKGRSRITSKRAARIARHRERARRRLINAYPVFNH